MPDPGIVPSNIVILLPYALCDALGVSMQAARVMATGNVFGAAHFLVQDRWLDGEEAVGPWGVRLADVCLERYSRAFHVLFPPDAGFWSHFGRYLDECYASLEWERQVLRSGGGGLAVTDEGPDKTLLQAGRRMSPLKATSTGAALLAGRPDLIGLGERIVEDFHAAYQLSDDIEDAAADFENGRWSVALWFLARRSGAATPADAHDAGELFRRAACSGALEELVELVFTRYRRASSDASELGAPILVAYLNESLRRAERTLGRMARRFTVTERIVRGTVAALPAAALPVGALRPTALQEVCCGLHSFEVYGDTFVYDTASGLFFEADGTAIDVLSWMRRGSSESGLEVLRMNHGVSAVDQAMQEFASLSARGDAPGSFGRPCDPNRPTGLSLGGLSSVALNVAGGCNLACDYCYLGPAGSGARLMSDEVAFRAVDLLFDESFGERELSVVFFGGEPLLNAGLIARTARHARHRAARDARRISFHTTTNGTLLTPEVAAMLRAEDIRLLVSIDGPRAAHDAHRAFRSGAGSYDTIASNIARLPDGARPGARATVTEESPTLLEIVTHLRTLGFGVVHLSPVSDGPMDAAFADRLVVGYEELAHAEREAALRGEPLGAGCFIEAVLSLELGRARLMPCGAGARYVSVANDGDMFLCHRFAGDGRYRVGDVWSGLDRFAVGRLLGVMAERSDACSGCWASGLCGGACFHDLALSDDGTGGPAVGPDSGRCRVRMRTLELAMWLHASLPEEHRSKLAARARGAALPEMAAVAVPGPGR